MNPLWIGVLAGILFGAVDVGMTVAGHPSEASAAGLCQAFFSRFAVGFLGANLSPRIDPVIGGALAGLLISLPDAFALHSYLGILGTGIVFGGLAGYAGKRWGK